MTLFSTSFCKYKAVAVAVAVAVKLILKVLGMNGGFKSLKVYQLAYRLAMEIFEISKKFPKKETYSLTDQIRRSSISVVWIDFAKDCEYINIQIHQSLIIRYEEVGKMLGSMANNPERFTPK